jgi:hypothetical protein
MGQQKPKSKNVKKPTIKTQSPNIYPLIIIGIILVIIFNQFIWTVFVLCSLGWIANKILNVIERRRARSC